MKEGCKIRNTLSNFRVSLSSSFHHPQAVDLVSKWDNKAVLPPIIFGIMRSHVMNWSIYLWVIKKYIFSFPSKVDGTINNIIIFIISSNGKNVFHNYFFLEAQTSAWLLSTVNTYWTAGKILHRTLGINFTTTAADGLC